MQLLCVLLLAWARARAPIPVTDGPMADRSRPAALALDQHIADELGRIDCVLTFKGSGFAEVRALLPTLVAAAGGATVPGTFIEIGALDGVDGSNSLLFEKCFGWSGALIEANRLNFNRLLLLTSGPKATTPRPNAAKFHSAVCAGNGNKHQTVQITVKGQQFSGEPAEMGEKYKNKWWRAKSDCLDCTEAVPCKGLAHLARNASLPHNITFLSLDVEGAEEKVLKTISSARFKIVLVEMDGHDAAKDMRVHLRLVRAGMRVVPKSLGVNTLSTAYVGAGVPTVQPAAWDTIFTRTGPRDGLCAQPVLWPGRSTFPDGGNCDAGNSGSWKLKRELTDPATHCWQRCLRCARCRFVTVTYRHVWLGQAYHLNTCEWHSACDLDNLMKGHVMDWTPKHKSVRTRGMTWRVR